MPDSDGELTADDVAAFTGGRIAADDPRAGSLLATALAAARRYCGWHVTPVRSEELVLDGPGSPLLVLPTLRLVALAGLSEGGTAVDLGAVTWSRRGLICKRGGGCWSAEFGAITADVEHGYEAADDWQAAVLSMVDRTIGEFSGTGREVIGPFQYPGTSAAAAGSAFSDVERSILDLYALEKAP